ncbi:cytochrome P450 [Cylindrobasidium torrendii FP15055 ss-10]|uniref:Cytochrome P450 n=1 Tax=Cylindrobasidium torrendii FP15055 ss-10 TaxID=1314674 RepID=A0A0D7BA91_9AGAR|nr:cytochrome P450 [Cylindrobasidium torrendii FP15055 ss-10]
MPSEALLILTVIFLTALVIHRRTKLRPFAHIPGPPAQSWFMGNLSQVFTPKGLPFHQHLVDEYGGMVKIHGFFGDEQLYISDHKALSAILGKDSDAFDETAVFFDTNKVIFGPGLVATSGDQHRRQRKLVMPVFSVPHIKALLPAFYDVAGRLIDAIQASLPHTNTILHTIPEDESVVDMSAWMCRAALETIGQTVLGYSFDPLSSPITNPYSSAIKELIPTIFSLSLVRQFAPILSRLGSPRMRRWIVEHTPNAAVQKIKEISDVMHATAVDVLESRRKEDLGGKDIISVLLRANEKAPENAKMDENELSGQVTVLIFGAQDTTSSVLSRILYLLAEHPEIQERVRAEVLPFIGRIEHDELVALPLLDAVIKETLRLHSPVPFVRRTATQPRTIAYGESSQSVFIPTGTTLFISIAGYNRLESIWGADAKVWNPDRFIDNHNAKSEGPGIYAGTLSFLGGPRSCPGWKFALVEMKIILSSLLREFRFSLVPDARIEWNLSQIIAPSVVGPDGAEKKGLPLRVERI